MTPKTTKQKFAVAGNLMGAGTVLFWTGAKLRPWSAMETRARTWAARDTAEKWLPKVEKGRAMDALRVLEVAP